MIDTQRTDTDLGTWTSSNWQPALADALFASVERIWDFEGTLAYRREQIFPSGTIGLVAQLDEPHRRIANGTSLAFPALCIDGQQTETSLIEAPRGNCRVLGISLWPLAAFALLGTSFAGVTDRSIDLRDVGGVAARSARKRPTRRSDRLRARYADSTGRRKRRARKPRVVRRSFALAPSAPISRANRDRAQTVRPHRTLPARVGTDRHERARRFICRGRTRPRLLRSGAFQCRVPRTRGAHTERVSDGDAFSH